ncbi:MAG: GNAT family N-acetyltransferase [Pseudonocardiales bacterium]|nr:GNAT family N-acetyltransferase [Pseudonocardiales bacterium]
MLRGRHVFASLKNIVYTEAVATFDPDTTGVLFIGHNKITIRRLELGDAQALGEFFEGISASSRRRYNPHPLTKSEAVKICGELPDQRYVRIVAVDSSGRIVGYVVTELFFPEDELTRYRKYGLDLSEDLDCRIAPVVADRLQKRGIGTELMRYGIDLLWAMGRRRIVLFGGTQATNAMAKRMYEKLGFQYAGAFEHKGIDNYDMYVERSPDA